MTIDKSIESATFTKRGYVCNKVTTKENGQDMNEKTLCEYEEEPIGSNGGWTIFVAGLSEAANESVMRKHFSAYGKIVGLFAPFDRRSGNSAGYAFIKYCDKENATAARRDMDGSQILGKDITVSFATVKANELKKDENQNNRRAVKKVKMRDIKFGRRK